MSSPRILIPFDRREAITVRQAAKIAGRSESTIKGWCAEFWIGRRVVGGPWQISRVALAMLLDGNEEALRAYLAGDRTGPMVAPFLASLDQDAA